MEDRHKKNIIELTRFTAEECLRTKRLPLVVMADNVRSMHNVGSLFRTADAFAFSEVVLTGISGVPPHPEISKTALGAETSVRWTYREDAVEEAGRRRAEGWKICVLEQTHGSVPLQEFVPDLSGRYMIVAGNEVEGVDQRIVDMADVVLEIPQQGMKHSLNVSVSSGIAMWHFYSAFLKSE